MADSLKEIFEEAGEFAEANGNKLILADAVVSLLDGNAYKKRCNNEIDLSVEDFFKMKYVVKQNGKLLAVKHVKDSAKCGLKEAKDFVDTYCDCVQND